MKFSEFARSLRTLTWTNERTLPLEEIVDFCNVELDTFAMLGSLPGLNETYFGKVFTRDLELWVRKYELPVDLVHIQDVRLNIAWTWEGATPYIGNDIEDETKILEYMKAQYPKYKIYGDTIKIYSKEGITAVTGGIKMEGIMYPTPFSESDFSTNDRDMSVPRDAGSQWLVRQFHKLLMYRVVIMYKESRDKPISLNQTEQAYNGALGDVIESLGLFEYNKRYKMSEPNDDYQTSETFDPLSTN